MKARARLTMVGSKKWHWEKKLWCVYKVSFSEEFHGVVFKTVMLYRIK
jgi:hypothetical protein